MTSPRLLGFCHITIKVNIGKKNCDINAGRPTQLKLVRQLAELAQVVLGVAEATFKKSTAGVWCLQLSEIIAGCQSLL